MNDDDLRARIAGIDPSAGTDPVPVDSDRGRALLEEIMQTTERPSTTRRTAWIGAVAAAVLATAVGLTSLGGTTDPSGPPLVLTADGSQAAMMSCLPFDVAILAQMGPAFGGTVVELTDSVATLEVDRWFTGGDAEIVEISYTPGYEALIGTPSFEVGQRYLITAAEGTVNGCGYSGLATPEYEAAFEEAFAG